MSTTRTTALAGIGALVLGVVLMLALHVVPPTSEISPVRRTLSQYALGPNKWIFDGSVLLIAGGSALGIGALVRWRVVRPWSPGVVFGGLWVLSLLVIVYFTKTDWSVGPSIGGVVHRYASVVAFVSLPLAVLFVAGAVFPRRPGWRFVSRALGAVSLAFFGTIVFGFLRMLGGGGPWWRTLPLGLVERAIAFTAVAAIVVVLVGFVRTLTPANSEEDAEVPA